ncbi:MAG: hypothetical protein KA536_11460 [Saprospiraceae bacterium]|nr:hypothetical protein [Saprospiraceae bacterium]
MSKRKRKSLAIRKIKSRESSILEATKDQESIVREVPQEMQKPVASFQEIQEALKQKTLIRNFHDAMTYNKAIRRTCQSKVRLKLPNMANLSSPGHSRIESSI